VVGPTLELHVGPYVILLVGFTLAQTPEPTCWPNVFSTLAQRVFNMILLVGFTLAQTPEPARWPNVYSTLAQRVFNVILLELLSQHVGPTCFQYWPNVKITLL